MKKVEQFTRRQHLHAFRPRLVDVFQKHRQCRDVVEVFVRDEDMLHPLLTPQIGQEPQRARIDGNLVVDEKRHEKLQIRRGNARAQQFNTHGLWIFRRAADWSAVGYWQLGTGGSYIEKKSRIRWKMSCDSSIFRSTVVIA